MRNESDEDPESDISSMPAAAQEQVLVDDLLYAFMGLPATYIKTHISTATAGSSSSPQVGFYTAVTLEPSLQEQVQRLLPIPEYVVAISRFVETRSGFEHGMVAQALAAALRQLQEEWFLMVTQLEHQMRMGHLSLQALMFYCQKPMASMELLANITVC